MVNGDCQYNMTDNQRKAARSYFFQSSFAFVVLSLSESVSPFWHSHRTPSMPLLNNRTENNAEMKISGRKTERRKERKRRKKNLILWHPRVTQFLHPFFSDCLLFCSSHFRKQPNRQNERKREKNEKSPAEIF